MPYTISVVDRGCQADGDSLRCPRRPQSGCVRACGRAKDRAAEGVPRDLCSGRSRSSSSPTKRLGAFRSSRRLRAPSSRQSLVACAHREAEALNARSRSARAGEGTERTALAVAGTQRRDCTDPADNVVLHIIAQTRFTFEHALLRCACSMTCADKDQGRALPG